MNYQILNIMDLSTIISNDDEVSFQTLFDIDLQMIKNHYCQLVCSNKFNLCTILLEHLKKCNKLIEASLIYTYCFQYHNIEMFKLLVDYNVPFWDTLDVYLYDLCEDEDEISDPIILSWVILLNEQFNHYDVDLVAGILISSKLFECAKYIIELKNIKCNYHKSLKAAINVNNIEFIKYLLEIGADPTVDNGKLLHHALKTKKWNVVKLFHEHGADIKPFLDGNKEQYLKKYGNMIQCFNLFRSNSLYDENLNLLFVSMIDH